MIMELAQEGDLLHKIKLCSLTKQKI